MIRRFFYTMVILMAILLTGCPYKAKFPIDGPAISIDKSLLGKWKTSKSTKDYWEIKQGSNTKMYKILDWKWSRSKKKYDKPKKYTAHWSKAGGEKFLNIKIDSSNYIFYRMAQKGAGWWADPITGNIRTKLKNSGQLKAFITKHHKMGFLYEKRKDFIKK